MAHRRVAVILLAASAVVCAGNATAAAADPPGTVVLSSRPSAYLDTADVDGLTPTAVIFRDREGIESLPLAGGSPKNLIGPGYNVDDVVGNMLFYDNQFTYYWRNLADAATGVVAATWRARSADGGLYFKHVDERWHLIDQNAETMTKTDLGELPGSATGSDEISASYAGVIVSISTGGKPVEVFFPAAGGGPVGLDTAGLTGSMDCTSLISSAVGCVLYNRATGRSRVARLSTTGAPPVSSELTHDYIYDAQVTATQTGWGVSGDRNLFVTMPAAGGPTTSKRMDGDTTSDESRFYYTVDGAAGKQGIYWLRSAAGTPTALYLASAASLTATPVVLTAGRAAWSDDTTDDYPVWTRTIAVSGTTITAGPRELISSGVNGHGTGYGVPVSASDSKTLLLVQTDTAFLDMAVVDGRGVTTTVPGHTPAVNVPLISGNRISYVDGPTGDAMLYDLVAGTKTNLTTTLGANPDDRAGLFGDEVAYGVSGGSVYEADLTSSAAPVRVARPTSPHTYAYHVQVWGNWVAYTLRYPETHFYVDHSAARNVRSRAHLKLPSVPQSVSNAGVVVTVASGSGDVAELIPWHSPTTPVTLPGPASPTTVIDGSLVGWLGADGKPRVSPLGVATLDHARSLGDPVVTPSVARHDTFSLDLPTSAALTECSVKITGPAPATRTVATLSCRAALEREGEVAVHWDVPGSQPVGAYTWTVTAGNEDGALRSADGTGRATSATFDVT